VSKCNYCGRTALFIVLLLSAGTLAAAGKAPDVEQDRGTALQVNGHSARDARDSVDHRDGPSSQLRRVRQIQIDRDAGDAESRIRELRDRIDAGEDFGELAAEYSEDRLSADRGGDMGRIARGELDRVLEMVIFSLPKGVVSQPVQTPLGWHVVEVTEVEESRLQPTVILGPVDVHVPPMRQSDDIVWLFNGREGRTGSLG
jgi:hypothetical protein